MPRIPGPISSKKHRPPISEEKPYQQMTVDGHLNMPRGYDVPPGAGGLLNGMRTFHYFTIPDTAL